MTRILLAAALAATALAAAAQPKKVGPNGPPEPLPKSYADTPPPGWLPVTRLDGKTP